METLSASRVMALLCLARKSKVLSNSEIKTTTKNSSFTSFTSSKRTRYSRLPVTEKFYSHNLEEDRKTNSSRAGFHLLQGVISTTVIPSCIPGESEDNCTALVQTEDNPRVAQVSITKCSSDMNGYCLHGQCIYLVDMSENYCRCDVGYTGVRCEHFFLTVHKPLSKEYVALTAILILLFFVITAGSIYYFCRWYKHRKSNKSKKQYERVTSGDPAVPQV